MATSEILVAILAMQGWGHTPHSECLCADWRTAESRSAEEAGQGGEVERTPRQSGEESLRPAGLAVKQRHVHCYLHARAAATVLINARCVYDARQNLEQEFIFTNSV